LKSRIATYLTDASKAAAIRIATIDSHAWSIQSGFNISASLSGGYEDNIKNVIGMIRENEGVFEYLTGLKHLFVDEAQDVVGVRVELLLELIHALPKDSGVTVFCDEAQAIYGFTEEDNLDDLHGTLPENIREFFKNFSEKELLEIHRTSDAKLKNIFKEGRQILKNSNDENILVSIRSLIDASNHKNVNSFKLDLEYYENNNPDVFLLFRRRSDAFEASKLLGNKPHRLRMSGLPHVIQPWIGIIFWDWKDDEIDEKSFLTLWLDRIGGNDQVLIIENWKKMVKFAGKSASRVDVHKLNHRLSSSSPPIEFCELDYGIGGPLVGTIHASKGREANEVRLYLPKDVARPNSSKEELTEEARVSFVGASRARNYLYVGKGSKISSSSLDNSGRTFSKIFYQKNQSRVEIGRIGDISADGLVGCSFFNTYKAALKSQNIIKTLNENIFEFNGQIGGVSVDHRYEIFSDMLPNTPLFFLSKNVNNDMFEIAKILNKRFPPKKLGSLRTLGTRTLVISSSDPIRERLHSPWRDSGFMLAPLLVGFDTLFFN